MGEAERGVIAAGHPLTAEAGARVLREGGNAVDAVVAAMLTSFVAEPLLTGLGAGRPHAGGRRRRAGGAAGLLRGGARGPVGGPPGAGVRRVAADRRVLRRRRPGLPRRPRLVRRLRHARRRVRGGQPLGDDAAAAPRRAGRHARPRRGRAQRRAGIRRRDPRRAADLDPRVRGAVGPATGASCARARCCATPSSPTRWSCWPARAPTPSTAAPSPTPWASGSAARGGLLSREDLAAYEAIPREPLQLRYRDREILTNPAPSAGGTLIAYSLALLDRGPSPPGPARASSRRCPPPRPSAPPSSSRVCRRRASRSASSRGGSAPPRTSRCSTRTGARAARPAPTARARVWSCPARGCTSTT